MKRPRRPRFSQNGQSLSRLLAADDDTITIPRQDRYQTAPVGPAPPRTHQAAGRGWHMIVDQDADPGPVDPRVRRARQFLELEVADYAAQGMLYRIDDAEQVRQRGEELDGRSVVAVTVAKAVRHLMAPAPQPQPDTRPWDHPDRLEQARRAPYDRAFNGNGAA